jgi:hypothetical protein
MTLPFGYAVLTILVLFAGAGGDLAVASARLAWVPVAYLVLSLAAHWIECRFQRVSWKLVVSSCRPGLLWGLGLGLVSVVVVTAHRVGWNIPGIGTSLSDFERGIVAGPLVVAGWVTFAVGLELYSRFHLAPQWGSWSVAFLDALAFGFGFQSWIVFVWFLLVPGVLGWKKLSPSNATLAHGLALMLSLSALFIGT